MNSTVVVAQSAEIQADIIRKILKLWLKRSRHLDVASIGEDIFTTAKQIGTDPVDVAAVLKPILQEVLDETFDAEKLSADFKDAEEHYDARQKHGRHCHHGGH